MKPITFELGQRVIAKNLQRYKQYNGRHCIIVQELGDHLGMDEDGLEVTAPGCYQVWFTDEQRINVEPDQLELGLPFRWDMDKKVAWADCAWQPKEKGENNDY